jgi:hypothetical protein
MTLKTEAELGVVSLFSCNKNSGGLDRETRCVKEVVKPLHEAVRSSSHGILDGSFIIDFRFVPSWVTWVVIFFL